MRTRALFSGDMKFQFRYGFYFLYLIFVAFYLALLHAIPEAWREKTAVLMIFTDPAAMGLYFMGAIILLEKSEHVLDSLAVSPVTPAEYTISKLGSIALVSTLAGLFIGIGGGISSNPFLLIYGVFLGSCLFSAVGLLVAANIASLNQFIVFTIPAEVLINLPAIAWLFGWSPGFLLLHPGVCIVELCQNGPLALPAAPILLFWTLFAAILTRRVMAKCLKSLGGVRI